MKNSIALVFLVALPFSQSVAQETPKSLASTLETYVFPADGQDMDQQSKDEAECYTWAVGNTGSDPFDMQKEAEQQVAQAQSSTKGAGAKGAVRGAAAGAVIGEVTGGDAGDSAANGAAAGAVSARRRGRAASAQAEQQAKEQEAAKQKEIQEKADNFKKAFGVCLEAKEYLVKF